MTLEEMCAAMKKTYGDPKYMAEMKRLNDEYDATLARMGLTRRDVENEIARRWLAELYAK